MKLYFFQYEQYNSMPKITLNFICNAETISQEYFRIHRKRDNSYRDPPISITGMQNIETNKSKIQSIVPISDLIISSPLLSALQTCLLSLDKNMNKPIYVVPLFTEIGDYAENMGIKENINDESIRNTANYNNVNIELLSSFREWEDLTGVMSEKNKAERLNMIDDNFTKSIEMHGKTITIFSHKNLIANLLYRNNPDAIKINNLDGVRTVYDTETRKYENIVHIQMERNYFVKLMKSFPNNRIDPNMYITLLAYQDVSENEKNKLMTVLNEIANSTEKNKNWVINPYIREKIEKGERRFKSGNIDNLISIILNKLGNPGKIVTVPNKLYSLEVPQDFNVGNLSYFDIVLVDNYGNIVYKVPFRDTIQYDTPLPAKTPDIKPVAIPDIKPVVISDVKPIPNPIPPRSVPSGNNYILKLVMNGQPNIQIKLLAYQNANEDDKNKLGAILNHIKDVTQKNSTWVVNPGLQGSINKNERFTSQTLGDFINTIINKLGGLNNKITLTPNRTYLLEGSNDYKEVQMKGFDMILEDQNGNIFAKSRFTTGPYEIQYHKITIQPSYFMQANTEGDYRYMIDQPKYARSLFLFNDNVDQFVYFHKYIKLDKNNQRDNKYKDSACANGSGNGSIREYQCKFPNPRAAGIPTGSYTNKWGILTPDIIKIIDYAFRYIENLLSTGKYDRIIYSADKKYMNDRMPLLGHGIFDVSDDILKYITDKIYDLQNIKIQPPLKIQPQQGGGNSSTNGAYGLYKSYKKDYCMLNF